MYNNHQENKLTNQSTWEIHENKLFESALTVVPEDAVDRWGQIASYVPGKTPEEIRVHYEALVYDLDDIYSGRVDHEIPNYTDDYDDEEEDDTELVRNRKTEFRTNQISFGGVEVREKPRKKGTPWTKDEHRKFLEGLAKYGKGDWRSISRNSVVTRTPTQVASHAQKYFNRLGASPKERKRSSIHDITISTTDTTMVDQPAPTPSANLYVAQGTQLPASPPTQPSNFYVGQGVGKGAPQQAPTGQFYGDQGVGNGAPPQAPTGQFYSDQGVGKGTPQQTSTGSFYGDQGVGKCAPQQASTGQFYSDQGVGRGAPQQAPTSHFYRDQGVGNGAPLQAQSNHFYSDQGVGKGAPTLPPQGPASNFYVSQGVGMAPQQQQQQQQQMGYGYQQNFVYPY